MPDALSETNACALQRRWKTVLGMVEIQLGNQADFNAYLANTQATSVADGVLHVTVKNGFIAAWIRQRVMRSLRRFTAQVFGQDIKIELETMAYTSSDVLVREGLAGDYTQWRDVRMRQQRANMARENAVAFPTIPNSTFERFESSDCNAQAMSASQKVVENPGTEFNPLTITAETGQGKTHLLNAIANQMRQNNLNVVCLTGEEFVDNYVKSSRAGNVDLVRGRYRGVDVLLVDGIERLIGKEKTQSFFLNIVEHLISNQKQLVFTFNSSYPMLDLGDEITSRLAGGLEIAIEPPDFKLKRSLLHRYANERHLDLAAEALDYLSNRVTRNVREIIGGIARVDAHLRFSNPAQSATLPTQAAAVSTVNLAVAIDAVRDRVSAPEPTMMAPEGVLDAVAVVFTIDVEELRRAGRGNRSVNAARDLAIYMLREKCGLTSSETGNLIGGRPHSTVLAALARYSERRQSDPQLAEAERRVERMLRQPS